MSNYFDRFDPKPEADSGNPFDKFDAPVARRPQAAAGMSSAYRMAAKPKPQERTWGQAIGDAGAGVMSGLAGLVKTAGQLQGLAIGQPDNFVTRLGSDGQDWWRSLQSDALQAKRQARSEKIDQADGFFGQAGTAIKETVTDPALLTDLVAENITSLIPVGGAAQLGAKAGAKAATSGAARLGREVAKEAVERTAARWGTGAAIGTGAAMQGADVGGETYAELMQAGDEVWQGNAEYARRVAAGEDAAKVKHEMALSAARMAGAGAAGLSVATQALPGAATIERALAGRVSGASGIAGRALNATKGLGGEGLQEALEEGGGQLIGNFAKRPVANTPLMEGVGESAGLGFVAGGAMGGAIGALQYVGEQPRVAARPVPQTPPEEVNGMKLLAAPNGETPYGVNIVTPSGEVITPEMRGEDPRVTGEPASPVPNPDAVPGVRVHENSLRPQVGVPNPDAVPGSLSDAANAVAAVRTAARPVPQNDVARAPASEAAKSLGLHEIAEAVRMQHPDALNSVGTEAEPIARPRTNREGMFGRMLREQAEAKRRAEAEQAGAETPAGELARAALPSVLPWTNAETGEIRNPSDTELRNVMHGFMNRLQESGLGMRKTFLFNKLREMDGGLNGARLNAAYKEVQAERKRGLMQAEESQPQAGNSIAAQSDISGQPIGKVAAEDAPMPGASDGELLSKQPENNPESPVAAENLFSGEVKTEAPQGVQAEAPVKHSEMGQSDEHPVTMQNRDRSRAASVVQMQSIRSYPDPERLGFSRDPNAGAPMVGEGAQVAEADKGATDVVVMASGRRVPVRYAVVEADAVAASHNADGHVNPDYDDAALKALNNGRTAGLQAAWGAGNADAYREGIIADARLHGVSPEAIAGKKRPMLVRLYDPAANTGDMGAESNASAQLGLSPVEQAQTDSRTLPDMTGIQFAEDGSISPASNAAFFRAWFHNIGATQAATLQDAQGRPNAQALQRLKGALVYQAYGDERLLTALAEDVNPERRNVLNAMAQAAPAFAALEQDNTLAQEAKAALTGALELLRQAGERGLSVQDMVAQGDMLGRNAAAETVALFMAENARSAKRMAEAFRAIAEHVDNAQMAAATHDIFGNAPTPTLRDSLEYANDRLAQEQDENTRPARFDTARIDWPAARADAASGRGQGQSTGRGRSAAEDAGASTAPARLDDGQGQQVSDGLFGAPSARDHVDAARRAKDAARDGRTGTGRTDMMAGDGELFAGPRPEQVDIERQQDFSHLNALEYRLHNERQRLANAKTDREREWREVVVQGVEKEVRQERETLGLPVDVDAGATDIDALASALEDDNAAQSELKRSSRDEQQRGNETGVPRGLPAERTANSDRLEQGINRWRDREGHPGHLRIREVRAEALPDALRHALDRFHDATGTRIVLFRNLTPEVDDFNGVTFGDGTAYVNENNQYPLTLTAAHEWLHNLRRTNPGLYWELADEVARQGDLPGYQQRLKRDGEPRWRNMDLVAEELTAAAVSDALTDPEFLQRLATRNRGLFRRVAEAFLDFLNTLTRGWRDQGSNQYLQDVEAFRDKLAAVLDALPENGAASGAADIDVLFQRVWHGTPHRGIEKTGFKLNKIGTGEGAQAYGWGIYFASQKEVAEGYRQDLAATIAVDGKPLLVNNRRIGTTGDSDVDDFIVSHMGDMDAAIADAREGFPDVVDKLESLRGKVQVQNQGQLYQVDIPEDSDLLDWDNPLSQQSPKVSEAVLSSPVMGRESNGWRGAPDGMAERSIGVRTGKEIYLDLVARFGTGGDAARKASEHLNSLGIPGLRYLDGDSRAAGEGSHNYVIWDEALLAPGAAQIEAIYSRKSSGPTPEARAEAERQFKTTERAYGGRAAYDKAKAAGKTKLTYGQWVQVRTPNFKQWFGDWEGLRAQKRLDEMRTIKVRVPDEWRGLSVPDLRAKVEVSLLDIMASGEPLYHPEIGGVSLVRKGVKKALSASADPAKLMTLGDLRRAFEGSFFASATPAVGDGPNTVAYEKLLARLSIDGTDVVAVFSVQKMADGRQFYNSVTLDDGQNKTPVASPRDTPIAGERATSANTGVSDFIRRALVRVNPSEVSKVVDPETGEPLVVYHGTAQNFDAFDNKKTGANDRGLWGRGHYFASSANTASSYAMRQGDGAQVMPAFVALKNPLTLKTGADLTTRLPDGRNYRELLGSNLDGSKIKEIALAGNHDGVAQTLPSGMIGDVVAYSPNQIKSATANNGDFDTSNDDIRFSRKAQTQEAYEARIDALFAGAKGNRQGVRILDRADMLDLLGHGDKPLHLVESAVGKKDSTGRVKHPGMTTEMWKRLPEWIENPVAAFESDTVDGRITLVAPDLVGGKPALVVLEPNGSMAGMDVHVAVNAYEKDNAAGVPTARWVRNGKLLYLDQKRSPTFSERSGLQLPRDVRQLRGYKHRVQTEADLHKYRAERDEAMFSRKPSNKRIASKPNEALADIEAAVREAMEAAEGKRSGPLLERARDKLADMTPAKVKDALRSTWLGALTLRHLTELGRDYFPTIGIYDDYRSRMSAHRNRLQQEANDVAEKVRDWAGKNVKAARALFDLMHDATIDGNDPAEEYKPLQFRYGGQLHEVNQKNVKEARKAIRQQMRDRSGDSKQDMLDEYRALGHMLKAEARRKKNYPALRQRWEALTKDAQQHYITMRDMYKARSEETEAALIARINDLEMENAGRKRVLINKIRQQFESQRLQGVYFPLQRYGQYFVAAEKSERSAFLMFDSLNKAEKAAKVLRAQGFTITASGKKGEGRASDAPSGTFVADVIEALRESKVSEATQDRIYQMYLEALPELSMRKHSIHRKAVPGFDPDAVRAFAHNMQHGAHQIARMHYAHKMSDTLRVLREQQEHKRRDPNADVRQVAAGDALLGELEKRDAWINNPQDSALTNMVSSFGFVYYLGASPAAALVNLTQTPLITYPYLAARYGATKAGRALAYAMKETTRTLGNAQAKLTDPDEIKALKRLQEIGALDKTQAHSLAGIAEGGLLGDNPKWRNAMEWIGIGFHKTEIMNREATGLATFRLARSAGASFDEAVQAASDAIFQTHYDYSNENRARFMQPGWAKVLLMFRQYSLNTTWHLARMVWQATKDADAETRKLARRNLAGILVMSSIFSGAMGLPMLKTVMGVLSSVAAVFGDDDEPWDAETEFAAFLSDMLGRDAARVVLHGAANAVTGADIASRVGLGELWIRDADRELDGRGEYFHLLEQVAGPLGGVLKNYFAGKSMIEDGKYWRGIETMLPKGLKDALKSARYATEGVNNLRGDPIVQDVSIRQLLLQFNGFTPAQVSEQYDTNNKLKNYEQYIRNRRQDLMNAIAMSIQKKDMSSRAKIVEKIKAFNRKYPEIAIDERAIRQSLMARARHSQNAEGGILLNQKLAPRVRDAVGV